MLGAGKTATLRGVRFSSPAWLPGPRHRAGEMLAVKRMAVGR